MTFERWGFVVSAVMIAIGVFIALVFPETGGLARRARALVLTLCLGGGALLVLTGFAALIRMLTEIAEGR